MIPRNTAFSKEYVKEKLEKLTVIFAKAAVGDFSQNIEIPEQDDDFTQLYTGIQIMLDVIRGKIKELENEIADKTQIQENLYKQEEELRAILHNIGDGLLVTDKYGQIQVMNQVAEELLRVKSADAIGKALVGIVIMEDEHGHIIPSEKRPVSQAIVTGKKTTAKYYYVRNDTSKFYVGLTVTPLILDKKIVGTVQVFRDLSRDKEIDKLKDEFISLASHELRTPMTAIKGFMSMIHAGDYGPINEPLQRPLHNISVSTERQIHLINDLLDVSRIQAGRIIYTIEDISIKQVIQESIASLQSLVSQNNIVLKMEEAPDCLVQADAERVKQILNNLIGNALKFTFEGGINISYSMDGDMVYVSVLDTGIGIEEKDMEKLFGKFQQINASHMIKPGGTGLGLYVSRELARKMGGDVWLKESQRGKGSTFVFSIPKAGSEKAKEIKHKFLVETQQQEKIMPYSS